MKKYIVEFLGTMFIAFIVLTTGNYLAIGAAVAVACLVGGGISGGAFNPAVTLAYLAAGKISTKDVIPYILAQIAGALIAFELIKLVYKR
jgi:aquaporin Z